MVRLKKVTTVNLYEDQLDRLDRMGMLGRKSEIIRNVLDMHVFNTDLSEVVVRELDSYMVRRDEVLRDLLVTFGGVTDQYALRFTDMFFRDTMIMVMPHAAKAYLDKWVLNTVIVNNNGGEVKV
jgi:hypothetical protein